jgi:hypothetical protein
VIPFLGIGDPQIQTMPLTTGANRQDQGEPARRGPHERRPQSQSTQSAHRRRQRRIAETAIQAVQIMIVTSNNSIIATPAFGEPLTSKDQKRSRGGRILRDGQSALREPAGNKIIP